MTATSLTVGLMALAILLLARSSAACRCPPSSFAMKYYRALNAGTPLSMVTVLSSNVPPTAEFPPADPVYRVNVMKVYAGCAPKTPFIAVVKSDTSSCGVWTLGTGQKYLLEVNPSGGTRIGLCDVHILQSSITEKQQDFLDRRDLCCNGECRCAGALRLECGSSCDAVFPPDTGDKCVEMSCGRCSAEFFRDGLPVSVEDPFP